MPVPAVLALLLLADSFSRAAAQPSTETVTTPEAFQAALKKGVKHVVVGEHLDLSKLSSASNNSIATNVVAFVRVLGNGGTATIRVCSPLLL
jgi:diaminopimelate decarboxylase